MDVRCWRGTVPAHMTSTTTMMMSSPALSWAAWPTSSIVTSSGVETHTHTHSESTKYHGGGRSLSQREDVKLPLLWTSAGKDKGMGKKKGDRRAEGPTECKFCTLLNVIKTKREQRSAGTQKAKWLTLPLFVGLHRSTSYWVKSENTSQTRLLPLHSSLKGHPLITSRQHFHHSGAHIFEGGDP